MTGGCAPLPPPPSGGSCRLGTCCLEGTRGQRGRVNQGVPGGRGGQVGKRHSWQALRRLSTCQAPSTTLPRMACSPQLAQAAAWHDGRLPRLLEDLPEREGEGRGGQARSVSHSYCQPNAHSKHAQLCTPGMATRAALYPQPHATKTHPASEAQHRPTCLRSEMSG